MFITFPEFPMFDEYATCSMSMRKLLGHALGMFHEQSRPDRDDEVEVKSSNIPKKYQGQFLPQDDVKDFGISYDHGSVMHYSSTVSEYYNTVQL